MYCYSCGSLATQGLNYCKRCGTSLTPAPGQTGLVEPSPKLSSMIWAIAAFGIFSVGALFAGLIAMTALRASGDVVGITAIMGSFMIFGITGLLIRLMSRLAGIPRRGWAPPPVFQKPTATNEFDRPQMVPPSMPVTSVTENTTRTFQAPCYKEPAQ